MSRTTTTAFAGQTAQSVSVSVPVVDLAQDYSVLERNVQEGSTVLKNIDADPTLDEFITYKYSDADSVSVHPKMTKIYDPTTKKGFVMTVKDEWIARTTETDGTVHDDPESIYLVYKTTKGANVTDGSEVLTKLLRLVGVAAKVVEATAAKNDPTYELSSDMLDRLLHGVTKPSTAN